jgi:hypothetical protein
MRFIWKWIAVLMLLLGIIGQGRACLAAGLAGMDIESLPEWAVTETSLGRELLLSDSPEMVSQDGILYQDKVQGKVRLFFYHVNAADCAKKLDVTLENDGEETAHIIVSRYGLGGPGYEWMDTGKNALTAYLTGSPSYEIDIPPGESRPLLPSIRETAVLTNMLINGIFDFKADSPVTVRVMMMPIFEESAEFAKTAKVLPADEWHLRGTFAGADRQLIPVKPYDPAHDGAVALTLADNVVDPFLVGTDATDGSQVVNYGNYGVVYQIAFPSVKDGHMAMYLAPLGGEYDGAIGINSPDVTWSPVATPDAAASRDFGRRKGKDVAFLGSYDGGESLSFTFSPPGASNLPVRIVVLPQ